MTRVCALVLGLAVLALAAPSTTLADGDPASDVLITDTIYFPYQPPTAATATKLRKVVNATRKAGQPVRVAVIQSPQDLGAVVNLYEHPREYARLLSQEIGNPVEAGAKGHREELIVVMPGGFGTANVPPAVDRKLRGVELPSNPDPDALAAAAGWAVQELAAATGHPVPATFPKPKGDSGGGGALTAVLVVLGLLVLVALLILLRVRSARPAAVAQSPGGNE
jgi:hypothetical protein